MSSTDETPSTPLPVAIGQLVAARRRRIGITRERLAQAGNVYGMTWGRTSIENIERGRFSPTIQTLYVLCRALSSQAPEGLKHKVHLLDLIPDDGEIEVADGFAITALRLRRFLGDPDAHETIGANWDEHMRTLTGPPPVPTLSEKRAAKKLDISVEELRNAALEFWGNQLDTVVSQEAGPDASPQARGHATRIMVGELRGYIESRDAGTYDG